MTDEMSSPETADAVLAYLAEHPTASHREIGRALGIGRSTAARAVRRLVLDGRLSVDRLGTGDGYPSRYAVPGPAEEPLADPPAPRRSRTRRGRRARRPRPGGQP